MNITKESNEDSIKDLVDLKAFNSRKLISSKGRYD